MAPDMPEALLQLSSATKSGHRRMHSEVWPSLPKGEEARDWLTCNECRLPSAASRKLRVTTVRTSAPMTASEASAQ